MPPPARSHRPSARWALSRGYRAWLRGDLDLAGSLLHGALETRPGTAEILLPLARVLSEQGKADEALARLNEVASQGPEIPAARVFRDVVLYDHGGGAYPEEAVASPAGRNVLSRALEALHDLRKNLRARSLEDLEKGPALLVSMPLAARWIAEVSGRALALLEECFHRLLPEGWVEFHHTCLARAYLGVEPEAARPGDHEHSSPSASSLSPASLGATPEQPPVRLASQKDWTRQVERAILARRYALVEDLSRHKDVDQGWWSPKLLIYRAFSLLAVGKSERSIELLGRFAFEEGESPWAQFLLGLGHASLGRLKEAGWAFVRVARFMDILADDITQGISQKLRLDWDFSDF